jgi:hypothetical protein
MTSEQAPQYTFTPFDATGIAEGFIEAESEEQVVAAWQYLHDTRLGYSLQGFFGRSLTSMLEQGVIVENGPYAQT